MLQDFDGMGDMQIGCVLAYEHICILSNHAQDILIINY